MSNKQGVGCINPLVQSNMEGTMGTVIPAGLPKADSLPHYSHDKALPISRAYFSYALSGQDALDFASPWGHSKSCVRNGPSPGIHSSATDGSFTIPAVYRPDKVSFPVDAGSGRCSGPQELAAKQRLAYYASSPRQHSPRAARVVSPVAVPNGHIRGSDAERCVGLAIPKPVYSHSPCCTERGCTAGHNYGMEHGPHRMSPHIYDEDWAAHYSRLAYLHKKGQEALAQQRGLQLEHGVEGIKDGKTGGYNIGSNGPRRPLPVMEPSYTYNAPHPFISATPEYCHRAPIPPQIYKGYPHAYDPRTLAHHEVSSKVYQCRSPISKYTPVPPCPNIYYPQNHPETYRTDSSALTNEHGQRHHMGQFQSPRTELISPPCSAVPTHHPLISKYPTYHPYGVHLNTNQAPTNEQTHPPFPMDQSERPLDFSTRRVQTPDSPRELCKPSGTSGAFHPTLSHYRCLSNTNTTEHSEVPGFFTGSSKEFPMKSNEEVMAFRHCISNSPDKGVLAKRPIEEPETDIASKKKKIHSIHQLSEDEPHSPSSPPMPVINKVFSLAPYKVYLEATGMLSSLGDSKSPKPQPEMVQLKQEPDIQNCDVQPNSGENSLRLKQRTQTLPANIDDPVKTPEAIKIKTEEVEEGDLGSQSEKKVRVSEEVNHQEHDSVLKEERVESDTKLSDSLSCKVVVKSDFEEEGNPPSVENDEPSTCKTGNAVTDSKESTPVPTTSPAPPPLTKFSLTRIPPHCLKLSSFKIVIPEVLRSPTSQPVEVPQSPVELPKPILTSSKHARYQFMELHQSLCRLLHCHVTQTPCQVLRDWLCKLDLRESGKAQKVSCLLGSKMREVWLKGDEMEVALQRVVRQLQMYIDISECPFPSVMRAGAVFVPMLVVKEVLFPQVQGTFIDQVLQEHRVELRPTTLSEERQLTQLHRKAFSSKLRRLLSLKHLPDIYPDVLNLLYHTNVCKFLGAETSLTIKSESMGSSDESTSCVNGAEEFNLESSTTLTPQSTLVEQTYCLKTKKKSRVKISSKRTFLDHSSSSEEDESSAGPRKWSVISSLRTRDQWEITNQWEISSCSHTEPHVEVKIEDETQHHEPWGRPLTSDDLTSGEETESTSSKSSHRSSMVLKLRKVVYKEAHGGRTAHYQKVTDSSSGFTEGDRKRKGKSSQHKRHYTKREFQFRSYTQNRSYLSKKRCRWVLRSAVQSAHLDNIYPDLVGKRIRHLYEENDKSEVWYRGVVLRIHEPHSNPLKTVFEVKYDSEPEWQYYLELLVDYKKGWLKVED